jgi:molybdopterin molybdotransferase
MAVDLHEALQHLLQHTHHKKSCIVPVEQALGEICAQEVTAQYALPKFDNSAMDGYAVLLQHQGQTIEVCDTIFAGDNKDIALKDDACVKIMTGAKIPKNCEAVVPFEQVHVLNDTTIQLPKSIKKEQHIRFIGEDIKKNEVLLQQGELINFSAITLLASQGITHIEVFKKPKVVVFASGEELKLHYEKIEEFQIYNSNTPTFIARCQELGCEVDFIGQARDSVASIKACIKNSLGADLIITSGGVSVGEADFTKEAFEAFDFETIFDGIVIKPGKPTVFGKIGSTLIINLPGNPLAGALIFELFVKVLIQRLKGCQAYYHNTVLARMSEELTNKQGRETIIPGYFDGEFFMPSKKRSPGMVSVLKHCNSMIVLSKTVQKLNKDAQVKVLPINWNFFASQTKDFLTYE